MQYNGIKIKQRTDKRWEAKKQINGKRITITGKTQAEVYEKLKEIFPKHLRQVPQNTTFYEYWDFFYNNYKKPNIKACTLKNYKSVFKNQIQPLFKDRPIKNISVYEINQLIADIKEDRMKEYASQYLRECFKYAYRDKKIKFDFWDEIKKYHHKRSEGTALSQEQRNILLQNTKKIKHGDIFEFYLFTGVRPAEGLNFAPQDIEKDMIHIKGTKTITSDRYIPKFKQVEEILNRQDLTKPTVFNISEVTLKRERLKLIELCGFKFNTKDLRTTFATMCAENGIAPKVIAKWLGHTTTSTTNKYYIKVLDQYEKEQQNQIEKAFRDTFADTFNSKSKNNNK